MLRIFAVIGIVTMAAACTTTSNQNHNIEKLSVQAPEPVKKPQRVVTVRRAPATVVKTYCGGRLDASESVASSCQEIGRHLSESTSPDPLQLQYFKDFCGGCNGQNLVDLR
jgi:hypothetical protein